MLDSSGLAATGATPENITLINQAAELLFRKKSGIDKILPASADQYPACPLDLNPIERECLYYYFHGFSAKETAAKMNLTFRTIQSYIADLKEHFGCSSKIELRKRLFSKATL